MRKFLIMSAALTALPVAALAETPRLSAIIAALEDKGYTVTDVDVDSRDIEIDARTADGRKWDIVVDPATGEIRDEREDR